MSIEISDIAFTGTPVTDIKKARAFYEGVLGLTPAHVFEQGDYCWLEYDIGPGKATLAIANGNPDWKPSPQGTTLALEVADFDAAIAHLRANNVTIHGEPFETPVCRMAIIADPDGNSISIHHKKPGHKS
jgi:predicted enzyme related to lactoylglutathione lyase